MSDTPSTLKPAQTAQLMVDYAVGKHRSRYESVFMKAVSDFVACPSLRAECSLVCCRCHVILWQPVVTNRLRRLSGPKRLESWLCQVP
jgi:hypothetical protein